MHEIAGFLRGFPPFDAASPDQLEAVVAATEIEFFPQGAWILRAGSSNDGHAHVVRTGHVELIDAGRVVDVIGPGDLVGVPSLVSDLPPGLDVRAAEDVLAYRVPADAMFPLLSGRSGLRFLARTVRDRVPPVPGEQLTETTVEAVGALARPAVVVEAGASVREVVGLMRERDASCALVTMPDGVLGIVTDHDLRNRVLAAGLDVASPIGSVATAPARTTGPSTAADDAVLVMLSHGIRHLPVVGGDGTAVGVVEDIDLLAAQSRTPVRVRRAVARASTPSELVAVAQAIRPSVVGAIAAGHPAQTVTTTLSALLEAVVAKAVELHVRERGVPPTPFVWLVTGSVARREAVLSSDLDSLMAWDGADDDPATKAWMRQLAVDVLVTLGACGLGHDDNGVRADDPRFSRSVDAWVEAVRGWADDPTTNQADIYLATLVDARPVWGHAAWAPVSDAIDAAHARPHVRSALHRIATSLRPPTGFVRDLVIEDSGEHAGSLDLKRGGFAPVVAVGRYVSALLPGTAAATVDRVRAAADHGLLDGDDARDLLDAFDVVQAARLDHQLDQQRIGAEPDDHVRPDALTTLERRGLRDAFRVVARVQRALPAPVARP
ncbi:MAG: putative nucleotidyltransferase substrate binding domain-containing protein [Candidatus Nanopelagicales bacterium]